MAQSLSSLVFLGKLIVFGATDAQLPAAGWGRVSRIPIFASLAGKISNLQRDRCANGSACQAMKRFPHCRLFFKAKERPALFFFFSTSSRVLRRSLFLKPFFIKKLFLIGSIN